MPDGALMDERRVGLVKSRMAAQAAAAKYGGGSGRFQYFGASVTTLIIARQMGITRMANVAGPVSGITAQDAGRRQQVILYNIDPVVYHFHLNRLTNLSIVLVGWI